VERRSRRAACRGFVFEPRSGRVAKSYRPNPGTKSSRRIGNLMQTRRQTKTAPAQIPTRRTRFKPRARRCIVARCSARNHRYSQMPAASEYWLPSPSPIPCLRPRAADRNRTSVRVCRRRVYSWLYSRPALFVTSATKLRHYPSEQPLPCCAPITTMACPQRLQNATVCSAEWSVIFRILVTLGITSTSSSCSEPVESQKCTCPL